MFKILLPYGITSKNIPYQINITLFFVKRFFMLPNNKKIGKILFLGKSGLEMDGFAVRGYIRSYSQITFANMTLILRTIARSNSQ